MRCAATYRGERLEYRFYGCGSTVHTKPHALLDRPWDDGVYLLPPNDIQVLSPSQEVKRNTARIVQCSRGPWIGCLPPLNCPGGQHVGSFSGRQARQLHMPHELFVC